MTYQGHIKNGVIVLDSDVALPEGAQVEVHLADNRASQDDAESIPSLYEQLEPLVGSVDGLPPDLAVNHDHYLYGTPKRS